ncbi:replication-relaxation family protein [Primorskyibacter aestuariivivens]|uniref:replication-relaxation family protein n=1 Tax=Primorskyibacter aestuariivivens TaxID=1888912 RepID=UPI002300846A|nr:replication-relaxation family protein [Primorskyibacter aestuariivivens]MDA7430287.1 replication-relaxation family protein [Primorskyibacter aestuariivivens]
MQQKQSDSLGRATFHHIAPQSGVVPTDREIRWLKHIERHGPQSSQYLHELTSNTHRCKDTALRAMQKLRAGGFLRLPPQQRQTAKADFAPYIYDMTAQAKAFLEDRGMAEPTVRPTGHWWHGYTISCVTSSIDIAAARHGVRYIPAHKILAIKDAALGIPTQNGTVIPDQLFALQYKNGFRAFALEVDRGTEPKMSKFARKSLSRSIAQYKDIINRDLHKSHYGLKANMLVLWVFATRSSEERFLELLPSLYGKYAASVLTKSLCIRDNGGRRLGVAPELLESPWHRAQIESVRICGA